MATNPAPQSLKAQILDLSRQNQIGALSPFMDQMLDQAIADGYYPDEARLIELNDAIIERTSNYREQTPPKVVVLGMSGGVDSALSAAIMKAAGYRVIGVTMPIHQDPIETERGIEACNVLGIEHVHMDLSGLYDATLETQSRIDPEIITPALRYKPTAKVQQPENPSKAVKVRRGNIRARLRMVTLYNLAQVNGGFVVSTDNLSELGAGFWTLHGDVGDYSPIQSLLKSWEVPFLARHNGVPESTVRAKPTDGLGIDAGDEAQLGCSYLEWDLMTFAMSQGFTVELGGDPVDAAPGGYAEQVKRYLTAYLNDERAQSVFESVTSRMGATWFKRKNPLNVPHKFEDRYELIDNIDRTMFVPECFRDA